MNDSSLANRLLAPAVFNDVQAQAQQLDRFNTLRGCRLGVVYSTRPNQTQRIQTNPTGYKCLLHLSKMLFE